MVNLIKQLIEGSTQLFNVVQWSSLADRIFRPVIGPNQAKGQLMKIKVPTTNTDRPRWMNR